MSRPQQYRKKPVVIEAIQFDGHNYPEVATWMGDSMVDAYSPGGTLDMQIHTLEGVMTAQPGDWIIRGVKGEFYPCKPEIFDATYDPAGEVIPETEI